MRTLVTSPFADMELARRLDCAEGSALAALAAAHRQLEPGSAAVSTRVAGAHVIFHGTVSPLSGTYGLGLAAAPDTEDLGRIEAFFHLRGAPVRHAIGPFTGIGLPGLLCARGYRPVELSTVLYQPLASRQSAPFDVDTAVLARPIRDDELELWTAVAAAGLADAPLAPGGAPILAHASGAVLARCPQTHCFLAEMEGWPVAAAAMSLHDGVAFFAGCSTVPRRRRSGAHAALLKARLDFAVAHGCDLAMTVAEPGSGAQRNAERSGFRVAFSRTTWQLSPLARI